MPTLNASNAAQLVSALASAKAGDTILLAGGGYGDVKLSGARFSGDVTIRSADADDPARFSTLKVWHSQNLSIDGIEVKFTPDSETQKHHSGLEIFYSEDVSVTNSRIVGGDAVNGIPQSSTPGTPNPTGNILGLPAGRGVTVRESTGVVIENVEVTEFGNGIVGVSTRGLRILSSEFHDLRTTPIRGSDFQDLVVDGNHLHSSKPWKLGGVGDHGDFIHLWTTGSQAAPSGGITITDNFMDKGDGISIMGIYLNDNGNDLGFEGVVIRGNVIRTGNGQGIRIEHVDGARIENNALLQPQGGKEMTPLIHLRSDSRNVQIIDNILSGVVTESRYASSVVERGSLALQWEDRFSPDHYLNALIDPLPAILDIDALRAVPGGIIEGRGVGPDMMRLGRPASGLDGYIEAERGSGFDISNYPFDATNIWGKEGRVDTAGASVSWDFGDGSGGRGLVGEHRYEKSGTYVVTADIRLADGRSTSLKRTIEAESPVALQAGFDGGFGDETKTATLKSVDSAVRTVSGPDGKAADLNRGEIVYDIDTEFFGNPEYSVTFDFKKDSSGTARMFDIPANLVISMVDNAVYVTFTTDRGPARLNVGNLGINDTDWHSLAFTFSGATGNAILYIDGEEAGRAGGFNGRVQSGYSVWQDLAVGDGFDGLIDNLTFLRGALSAADVKAGRIPAEGAPSAGGGAPVTAPSEPEAPGSVADADLAAIAAAIASGDLAGLARETGRTLVTGGGSSADEVVRAGPDGWRAAWSNGGEDVLVGDAGGNWLVGGAGSDVMHGGAGEDDFRFYGRDAAAAGSNAILDLDFGEGDRIVMNRYADGTFSGGGAGLNVFSGGASAIVTSMAGLERLAAASSDVTLDVGPDGLSLGIAQGGGLQEILLL